MVQTNEWKPSLDVTGQSPLRKFSGVMEKYAGVPGKDENSGREYMSVELSFTDVEVIETVEPYPYPIAQVRVGYSQSAQSRWGALAKSIRRLLGPTGELDHCLKKRMTLAMKPYLLRVRSEDGSWGDAESPCWQVEEIEGAAAPEDLTPYIVGVADGKLDKDIYSALLTDPKIMARPEIVTSITDRKLLDTLVMAGALSRDTEGIFHRNSA